MYGVESIGILINVAAIYLCELTGMKENVLSSYAFVLDEMHILNM